VLGVGQLRKGGVVLGVGQVRVGGDCVRGRSGKGERWLC